MPQKRMECFRLLLDHLAWIKHQFLSGIRDSRKVGSVLGMMRIVREVRKSVDQSWLAKGLGLGLGLGLLCGGFKGVHEEIPREEASTLQIGSVAFPAGQYSSPQLYPCHRLFDQDGHQDSSGEISVHNVEYLQKHETWLSWSLFTIHKQRKANNLVSLFKGTSISEVYLMPKLLCRRKEVIQFNPYLGESAGSMIFCPVGRGCRIHRLHLCRRVRPSQWVSWIWH